MNDRTLSNYRLLAEEHERNSAIFAEFSNLLVAYSWAEALKAERLAAEKRAFADSLSENDPRRAKAEEDALKAEHKADMKKARANKAAENQDDAYSGTAPFDVISGDDEWYTPPEIVDRARQCMGGIDLDPASNAWAQEWIAAERHFAEDDDGLEQEWTGRVWMNPPYSRGLIGQFVEKLVSSSGITQAVVITGPYFDTGYGQSLLTASNMVCLVAGRIKFLKRSGARDSPPFASMLHGVRVDPDAFREAFSDLGAVWAR